MGWLIKLWEYNLSVRDFLKRIFTKSWELFGLTRSIYYFLVNLNNDIFIFLWCCLLYLLFLGGDRKKEASTFFSLRASSPFGEVARSHARAARERRRECERCTHTRVFSRLTSLATPNRELARAQANLRQRSRVVSASDSQCGSPGFEFRFVLGHTCNLSQTDHWGLFFKISLSSVSMQPSSWAIWKAEPLIFKHWPVSWPPTHLLG